MEIRIKRTVTNHLYTEAELSINGRIVGHTVEVSDIQLPEGVYQTAPGIDHLGRHVIDLFRSTDKGSAPSSATGSATAADTVSTVSEPTGWHIGLGHSWISSEKHHTICFGRPFFPGAVNEGEAAFERMFDRMRKCIQRCEAVSVVISDRDCRSDRHPHHHWL